MTTQQINARLDRMTSGARFLLGMLLGAACVICFEIVRAVISTLETI